jgi:hypothetical protein
MPGVGEALAAPGADFAERAAFEEVRRRVAEPRAFSTGLPIQRWLGESGTLILLTKERPRRNRTLQKEKEGAANDAV